MATRPGQGSLPWCGWCCPKRPGEDEGWRIQTICAKILHHHGNRVTPLAPQFVPPEDLLNLSMLCTSVFSCTALLKLSQKVVHWLGFPEKLFKFIRGSFANLYALPALAVVELWVGDPFPLWLLLS